MANKFISSFLILAQLLALAPAPARASITEVDKSLLLTTKNYATNGGAENGKAGWVTSGTSDAPSDLALTTTAAGKYEGNAAFTWTPANADNYLTNTSITVTSGGGLSSANCAAIFWTKTTVATHALEAYDGTNVLATVTIPASTTFVPVTLNWPCPASGTVAVRFNAGDTTAISFDSLKWGDARGINLSNVAQNKIAVTAYYAAGCDAVSTSASYTFPTHASCSGPTISQSNVGTWLTTDANGPRLTGTNLPPGTYVASFRPRYLTTSSSTQPIQAAIYAGGTQVGSSNYGYWTTNQSLFPAGPVVGVYTTTTAQASIDFEVRITVGGGANGTVGVWTGAAGEVSWIIEYFPAQSEIAVKPEAYNWSVNATITSSSGEVSLGTSDVTSPAGLESGNLTLVNNTGSGANVLTAQIPCSSTNASSGTTCSVGSESLGVVYTQPTAGEVEACATFSYGSDVGGAGTSGSTDTTFSIVETPNAAQTISTQGKKLLQATNETTASRQITYQPLTICEPFYFSAGQHTLRLFYEQDVANTVTVSAIYATAHGSIGTRNVTWVVRPKTQNSAAPLLIQSVTSPQNTTGSTVVNNYVTKSSGYTATASDETIEFTSSATLTLPPAASNQGKKYHVIARGASVAVTIDPNSSETVCNQTTIKVIASTISGSSQAIDIQSDGTNWQGLAGACWTTEVSMANIAGGTCTTGTCSRVWSTGGISSVTFVSTGTYDVNFTSGAFSTGPSCVPNATRNANIPCDANNSNCTTSSCRATCYTGSTGAATNDNVSFTCTGPR